MRKSAFVFGGMAILSASLVYGQTTRSLLDKHCVECHNTTNWTTVRYTHSSVKYPDHGTRLTCRSCHTAGSQVVPWPSAAYAPDCAACHSGKYKPSAHTKYGSVNYTVSELRDCAGACHIYSDSTLTTIRTRRTGHHRANSGAF